MKKKIIFLLALSILLVTAVTMNSTLAYFTTYAQAKGGYTIHLGHGGTSMETQVEGGYHHVVITNDGQPAYVRVRVFTPSDFRSTIGSSDNKWVYDGNGYWYYNEILGVGSTSELLVEITPPETHVNDAGDQRHVIIIYESTPQQFDDHGNTIEPKKADWNREIEGGDEG